MMKIFNNIENKDRSKIEIEQLIEYFGDHFKWNLLGITKDK